MFDHPEFWNPKVRAADCLNPPAARTVLPYAYKRTELLLGGHSKQEVIAAIKAAIDKKELPALEPRTVSYMMSKDSYLTDYGGHNGPHMMFYETAKDGAAWGANLANSPVLAVNYWYISAQSYPQLKSFPPLSVFLVGVTKWSDGTPAPSMSKDPAANVKSRGTGDYSLDGSQSSIGLPSGSLSHAKVPIEGYSSVFSIATPLLLRWLMTSPIFFTR